jgi:precorrin-6A/cobalt-precorrin-6A reductase
MILLLGGTSETASIAEALASAGYEVLVSMATEIPLNVGHHPNLSHRRGRLLDSDLADLIRERNIEAVMDATHPYAVQVRAMAQRVSAQAGIYYATFLRPATVPQGDSVRQVPTHEEAAIAAFGSGKSVLLTIGSQNLKPYAEESARTHTAVLARVLPHPDSVEACRRAGIPQNAVLTGRGPFSIEENRKIIREYGIGVLVTKDSGTAGGVPEKLKAARLEGCSVIVVARPPQKPVNAFEDISTLLEALSMQVGKDPKTAVAEANGSAGCNECRLEAEMEPPNEKENT